MTYYSFWRKDRLQGREKKYIQRIGRVGVRVREEGQGLGTAEGSGGCSGGRKMQWLP